MILPIHKSLELSFQKMAKTNGLKLTGNESADQHYSGFESAKNNDLMKMEATIVEDQEGHEANQETRNPPKLGLVRKIQKMFGWCDGEIPEPKQGRRVSLAMMFH